MNIDQEAYNELSYYSLAHGDPEFIHQHSVDAFGAQTWSEKDKPIKLAFALAGLYLYIEKGYSGRQVQLAHMQLAQKKQTWPVFDLPATRGGITVRQVLAAAPGPQRDEMIRSWCASVWNAYGENREFVSAMLGMNGII